METFAIKQPAWQSKSITFQQDNASVDKKEAVAMRKLNVLM